MDKEKLEMLAKILENPENAKPKFLRIKSKRFPFVDWVIEIDDTPNKINDLLEPVIYIKTKGNIMLGYDVNKQSFIPVSQKDFEPSPIQKLLPIILVGTLGYLGYKKFLKL
ncbi:hypothetical protein [Persephonella sp.]